MFSPKAPGGVAAVANAVRDVKIFWLLVEVVPLDADATTRGVDSPVSTVAGHENVPPEQSQLEMVEGVAVVSEMVTS